MNTFKDRLVAEEQELTERISKLEDFINSEKFQTIDPMQQSLLSIQLNAMETYQNCLNQRLGWLQEPILAKIER